MLIDLSTDEILKIKKLVQKKIDKQHPLKVTIFNVIMQDIDDSLKECEVSR